MEWIHQKAPLRHAEEWDNVGLLVGNSQWSTESVVVSVDLTQDAVEEAKKIQSHLIVTHHPCIFKSLSHLSSQEESDLNGLMITCLENQIAVFASHTNFDRCALDVIEKVSEPLGVEVKGRLFEDPILARKKEIQSGEGYGFWGELPREQDIRELSVKILKLFQVKGALRSLGNKKKVKRLGFVAGKGASFLSSAKQVGCDLFVTGEAGYHASLSATRSGMNVLEVGHRDSELFFLEVMGSWIQEFGLNSVKLNVPTQEFLC